MRRQKSAGHLTSAHTYKVMIMFRTLTLNLSPIRDKVNVTVQLTALWRAHSNAHVQANTAMTFWWLIGASRPLSNLNLRGIYVPLPFHNRRFLNLIVNGRTSDFAFKQYIIRNIGWFWGSIRPQLSENREKNLCRLIFSTITDNIDLFGQHVLTNKEQHGKRKGHVCRESFHTGKPFLQLVKFYFVGKLLLL